MPLGRSILIGKLQNTYLCQIGTQWLLTQHMQSLLDSTQGLTRMHIRTRRHPHGIQRRHGDHFLVRGEHLDVGVLVGLTCPVQLVIQGAADSHDVRSRDSADQSVNVPFAHAPETSDGDVELVCLD